MIPMKSKATESALAIHNAIMHVSEVYGRQLAELSHENAALRAENAALRAEVATAKEHAAVATKND